MRTTETKTKKTPRKHRKISERFLSRKFTIVEQNGKLHKDCRIVTLYQENGDTIARFTNRYGAILPQFFKGSEVTDVFSDGNSHGISWKPCRKRKRVDRELTASLLAGIFDFS